VEHPLPARLRSLDVYRGFIILAMISGGFGFLEVSQRFPDSALWSFLARQFEHVTWEGYSFWDLIQPSFMFMVGVAIPLSYARRRERGDSDRRIRAHALTRAAILFGLGLVGMLMLRRIFFFQPPWPVPVQTTHILVQIGVTYALAFPLVRARPRTQFAVAIAILAATYVAYVLYPAPEPGLFAHWRKDTNLGAAWDRWLVGLSPHDLLDRVHELGLTSLNFGPGVSTVLAGMLAGAWLGGTRSPREKLLGLVAAAAACFAAGAVAGKTLCPIVKLLWTPSFALLSTGWTLAFLAFFYAVIDVRGWSRWSIPLSMVGRNSILLFVVYSTLDWWIVKGWSVVVGRSVFDSTYGPLWESLATLLSLWALAAVLYGRRVFVRL
jgi:predicted acyltransferase